MHFITFPVASTNIFPLSNSTHGGQLATEFNLKSRDMVATNPAVKYPIGPSFLHCKDDFKVKLLEATDVPDYDPNISYKRGDYCRYGSTAINKDTYVCIKDIAQLDDPETVPGIEGSEYWIQTSISTSILQIGPGRGVINGHYVETLAPMQVDLNLANAELRATSQEELYGNLSIGIKTYFSTENTMAGAMLVENTDNMYVGVQLVVTKREDFTTPEDCPEESQEGTAKADIKLADFTYVNGVISASSITQNPNVMRYIPSDRIRDFSSLLDSKYVSSDNLVDKFFYTYSGKSGWCDSTGSLMEWDAINQEAWISKDIDIPPRAAQFTLDSSGNVHLVIPHKQPDAEILNPADDTQKLFYMDRDIKFPTASYASSTSGIVTAEYTNKIKDIDNTLRTYKMFTGGKQIAYWETLTMDGDSNYSHDFPTVLTKYDVGDYILVREDFTVSTSEDEGAAPATMYFILPGYVNALNYVSTQPEGIRLASNQVTWYGDEELPEYITEEVYKEALKYIANFYSETKTYSVGDFVAYEGSTYRCTATATGKWDATKWEEILDYNADTLLGFTTFTGTAGEDYFEVSYHNQEDTEIIIYYYVVFGNSPKRWSEGVLLTGGIPLAAEDQIGGFYNASTDAAYADAGYVYMDETGHLKLVDYELLRTGALAYQLGADFTVPANQTVEYIQNYLDESVNARVAFRTNTTLSTLTDSGMTSVPPMIDIYIPIPSDEEGTINIYNLDSRFGTGVYLHFLTDDRTKDYSNLIINISDCEKIRIDSSITTLQSGGPIINVIRSCLYYDAAIIDYIRICDPKGLRTTMFTSYSDFTGFDGLTLWYAKFNESDPNLIVNGMEVSQPNAIQQVGEISFWDEVITGDNHYNYALRSITLSGYGSLIGCSLYLSNGSTVTDAPTDATTKHIILGGDFNLPNGPALNYPTASLDSELKVTGTFTTAYQPADNDTVWIVTETSFTATTGTFTKGSGISKGMIAFNSTTDVVEAIYTHGLTGITGWQPGSYHIFYGGATLPNDNT